VKLFPITSIFIKSVLMFTASLSLCFNFIAYAQPIKSDQLAQLTILLKTYGQEVKSSANFYLAGTVCHKSQLDKIVYITNTQFMYLFFNDSLGNCVLASINLATNTKYKNMPGGCLCKMSDTVYKQIYTPWSLGALENFDSTQQVNPGFKQLATYVHNCLVANVVEITTVLNELNTSSQVTGMKP